MSSEFLDKDPVDAINQELEGKLEGIDCDAIVNRELNRLDMDYAMTIAATIDPIECFQESVSTDHDWEAEFEEEPEYQICPSESESETEETEEQPLESKRDFVISPTHIDKIKSVMSKIQIPHPFWAKNIPDQRWVEMMKKKADIN